MMGDAFSLDKCASVAGCTALFFFVTYAHAEPFSFPAHPKAESDCGEVNYQGSAHEKERVKLLAQHTAESAQNLRRCDQSFKPGDTAWIDCMAQASEANNKSYGRFEARQRQLRADFETQKQDCIAAAERASLSSAGRANVPEQYVEKISILGAANEQATPRPAVGTLRRPFEIAAGRYVAVLGKWGLLRLEVSNNSPPHVAAYQSSDRTYISNLKHVTGGAATHLTFANDEIAIQLRATTNVTAENNNAIDYELARTGSGAQLASGETKLLADIPTPPTEVSVIKNIELLPVGALIRPSFTLGGRLVALPTGTWEIAETRIGRMRHPFDVKASDVPSYDAVLVLRRGALIASVAYVRTNVQPTSATYGAYRPDVPDCSGDVRLLVRRAGYDCFSIGRYVGLQSPIYSEGIWNPLVKSLQDRGWWIPPNGWLVRSFHGSQTHMLEQVLWVAQFGGPAGSAESSLIATGVKMNDNVGASIDALFPADPKALPALP